MSNTSHKRNKTKKELLLENEKLCAQLEETKKVLYAIQNRRIDALVISNEQKNRNSSLEVGDHSYRVLLETMNEGAATLIDDGVVIYCNSRLVSLLKAPIETLTGSSFNHFITPSEVDAFEVLLKKGKNGMCKGKITLRTQDGTLMPVLLSMNKLKINKFRGVCMVVTDLTKQRRNEELVDIERLALSILEQAAEAIAVCDVSGQIIRANQSAHNLCGRNPLLQSFETLFPLQIKGKKQGRRNFRISTILRGEIIQGVEMRLKTATNACPGGIGEFNLLVSAAPIRNTQNAVVGCIVTLTNITERKRVEEELRALNESLEQRVAKRTAALVNANEELQVKITERKRVEEALRKSEASLANAQRIAHLGNWEWDILKNKLRWSDETYRIFGLAPQAFDATYEVFLDSVHPDDREFVKISVHDALYERKPYNNDHRIVLPDGSVRIVHEQAEVIFDNTGNAIQMNGTVQDVTEFKQVEEELRVINESLEQRAVKRTAALAKANEVLRGEIAERMRIEEIIKHMAFHDVLTALPNRVLFNDRLTLALARAHRNKEMIAVLFLDLDRFKVINDTLGHTMGDHTLHAVAERLVKCVREEDTIARLGGDEFTLLVSGITQAEHVSTIARKILDAFKQPWMIGGHELYITTSIGIALYPKDGEDVDTLMKNADTAMYHAKEQGKNNYQFYSPAMRTKSLEKMVLESGLRRALERKEFLIYYQPLVDINTGKVVSIEALVRWQHPDRGLISPEVFLSLAEDTRLIVAIDELVLHTVCAQNKAWQDEGFQPSCVAVNLSAHTFQQHNLVEIVTSVLKKTGLDPRFLGLEITESIAMQNLETTIQKLNKLSDLGIQIALDDFGTGFSSLCYLKIFPINKLKISQHFVCNIVTDQNDKVIVESIIAMAQGLKFRVVAEGVETEDQFIFLKERQCDEMQGHLFCKPFPAELFGKMLMQNKNFHDYNKRKKSILLNPL